MRSDLRTLLLVISTLLLGSTTCIAAPTAMHFVTKQFPPYSFVGADGQPAGPMVELMHEACAKARWRCTVDLLPWRRAINMAERKTIDGIFPIVDSPERRSAFQLGPDVVRGRYVLLGRAGRAGSAAGRPVALAGRLLAAYGPSDASVSLRQFAQRMPDTQVEIEPDQRTVLRKLLAGRYGADGLALVNEAVAQKELLGGAQGLQTFGVVKEFAYTYAFVGGQDKASPIAAFTDAIYQLCRSGRTAEIFKPYGLQAARCQQAARSG